MHCINIEFTQNFLEELSLVGGVVDAEILSQSYGLGSLSQQPGAELVKRADPHSATGKQFADAICHFVGGLIGERKRQNVAWIDSLFDHAGYPLCDDPRLPRTRSCQHQKRSVNMFCGPALTGRQVLQACQGNRDSVFRYPVLVQRN